MIARGNNIILCFAQEGEINPDKHQRPLNQAALRPVPARAMQSGRRLNGLRCKGNFK